MGFILMTQSLFADAVLELLQTLTETHGASGFEGPVRKIVEDELQGVMADLHLDGLGNLIGKRETETGHKPRVLLMAHLDEVGFLVREISEEGFIFFDNAGGWIDQVILEQKWVISTPKGPIIGVTGAEPPHVILDYPKQPCNVSQKKMFLDIGVRSKEEAEALGIRPGLPITPYATFHELSSSGRYLAKAIDDRVGLAALITTLKNLVGEELPCEIVLAATVQEETFMRGSQVIFDSTQPDVVFNIEVGIARDFPVLFPNHLPRVPRLGERPSIFVYDATVIPNHNLIEHITSVAKEQNIPFQYECQGLWYGNDGCRLQVSGKGIPVINLGIPTRYVHSHYGVMERSDFDQMVELLQATLRGFTSDVMEAIRDRSGWY